MLVRENKVDQTTSNRETVKNSYPRYSLEESVKLWEKVWKSILF